MSFLLPVLLRLPISRLRLRSLWLPCRSPRKGGIGCQQARKFLASFRYAWSSFSCFSTGLTIMPLVEALGSLIAPPTMWASYLPKQCFGCLCSIFWSLSGRWFSASTCGGRLTNGPSPAHKTYGRGSAGRPFQGQNDASGRKAAQLSPLLSLRANAAKGATNLKRMHRTHKPRFN
ncbi:mll9508 (plasmid) [Mesorhizobium japonicum MAFF 303099]|uniref:Mll9508 protein n=1 Tax=Mesorhizobium japonicum (strain LMG 29417 / CECT 9101 / MAFF 303099) TaxID=266835 RepID=Q98PD3_RHILO|nr:mll9508 [Mesorhizobium japonicum MAFF 303099]